MSAPGRFNSRRAWIEAGDPFRCAAVQVARLQPTINDIDSRLTCDQVQAEATANVTAANRPSAPTTTMLARSPGMEVVLSWPNPAAKFAIGSLTVRDRAGRVVGDLSGEKRIGQTRKRRKKIGMAQIAGQTFATVTFKRPAYGGSMTLTVTATTLPASTPVTIQIQPTDHPRPACRPPSCRSRRGTRRRRRTSRQPRGARSSCRRRAADP